MTARLDAYSAILLQTALFVTQPMIIYWTQKDAIYATMMQQISSTALLRFVSHALQAVQLAHLVRSVSLATAPITTSNLVTCATSVTMIVATSLISLPYLVSHAMATARNVKALVQTVQNVTLDMDWNHQHQAKIIVSLALPGLQL